MRMRSKRGRVESQTRASNATRGGFASVEIEEFEELPFLFFFSFLFFSCLSFSFLLSLLFYPDSTGESKRLSGKTKNTAVDTPHLGICQPPARQQVCCVRVTDRNVSLPPLGTAVIPSVASAARRPETSVKLRVLTQRTRSSDSGSGHRGQ